VIEEAQSIISSSPSPLEQLSRVRDADSLSRLLADVRKARVEREGTRLNGGELRPRKAADLETSKGNLLDFAKARVAGGAVQQPANQQVRSDTANFSSKALQLAELPANPIPPQRELVPAGVEPREPDPEDVRKAPRSQGKGSQPETKGSRDASGGSDAGSVESKVRLLFAGLRKDFESSATAASLSGAAVAAQKPEGGIARIDRVPSRAPGAQELAHTSVSKAEPQASPVASMAPLVGLRIEKSESGALVVSRLPNRVKIDGRQFDFSDGPLRVRPDGTVADSADKSGANEESGDEVSSGALLGLAVRGDSNVKLSPKGGKINATAVSEGKIEVNGVKVGLESGTSILVGAGSGGDVELDEAETRVTLGREVFNLKGGQQIRFEGASVQSASNEGSADASRSRVADPAVQAGGFSPFRKR
jgi:hypothetical protein